MKFLQELILYFEGLSNRTDKIREMNRDSYKHNSDMEILEMVLDKEIETLNNESEREQKFIEYVEEIIHDKHWSNESHLSNEDKKELRSFIKNVRLW